MKQQIAPACARDAIILRFISFCWKKHVMKSYFSNSFYLQEDFNVLDGKMKSKKFETASTHIHRSQFDRKT